MAFFESLAGFIQTLDRNEISAERKEALLPMVAYVRQKRQAGKHVQLNFICTHNSRRSQFSQVWAQVLMDLHGIDGQCYSGGVEVTACNPRTIASLERSGFVVDTTGEVENPHYLLRYSAERPPIEVFSKLYDDPTSPSSGFAAIMTCDHADENCPFIPGAEARLPMRFEDPKVYDDTSKEAEMYDLTSSQIARELLYIFEEACHD